MTFHHRIHLFLLFIVFLSALQAKEEVPPHARQLPPDSFFVFSLKPKNLIDDSSIKKSSTWGPILQDWGNRNPDFLEFFIDPNSSGLNFNQPVHFFSNLQGNKNISPIVGFLASVKNQEIVDAYLHRVAETLKIKKKPSSFVRFGNDVLPYEFGRKGRFVYFVAVIRRLGNIPNDVYLDEVFKNLFSARDHGRFPSSLGKHLSNSNEFSIYLDGSGIARLVEAFWPSNQWQNVAPLIEWITNRSIGVYAQANKGSLKIEVENLTDQNQSILKTHSSSASLNWIPGDSPVVAKIKFNPQNLKTIGTKILGQSLKALSNDQLNLSQKLPGLNLSISEILSSTSGDWILGVDSFETVVIPPTQNNPTGEVQLNPIILAGLGIKNQEVLRKLSIGLETSNLLGAYLQTRGINILEKEGFLWFLSPEYKREMKLNKTLRPLHKERKQFLESHNFAADLRILPLTQSIRRNRRIPYDYYKTLDWIEHFKNIRIYSSNDKLNFVFRPHDKKANPLKNIFDLIGQEFIDRKNASMYQAIAQNDFNSLQEAVEQGALINANDHFGHSPLHYAAYKGNSRFVDFLLRNGGNPNARSKHLSTPLHSAAWGRNLKVAEILLEDGADVNAETDEGETPAMTAALRGEKDLLEILFSLSADPHAKDVHGSNLYDLASAGGHLEILEILDDLEVKNNHPFHAAAGRGDLILIKKMLQNGRSINEKDAFGATPLIIATVSGKVDVVNFLLKRNADPMIKAKEGYSMMHAAAFSGKKELVQLAYKLGLGVNERYGKDGVTPVDVGEDASEAMPYLESLGGRRGWELGKIPLR